MILEACADVLRKSISNRSKKYIGLKNILFSHFHNHNYV